LEQATYEYCDEFRSLAGIVRHLNERFPATTISGEGVQGFLDSLITHRLMVTDGCHYLSLAVPIPPCLERSDALETISPRLRPRLEPIAPTSVTIARAETRKIAPGRALSAGHHRRRPLRLT
jgi:hypothetical protein